MKLRISIASVCAAQFTSGLRLRSSFRHKRSQRAQIIFLSLLCLFVATLLSIVGFLSQSVVSAQTSYPTPSYNPASYIPAVRAGKTVTVRGENLADKIQAAQDDASVATGRIEGGGSIPKQVTLRKHTVFDSSTYACDVQGITDQGQFLVADGVLVEGTWRMPKVLLDYFKFGNGSNWQDPYLLKVQALTAEQLAGTGTTILEPTYVNGQLFCGERLDF